MIAPRACVRLAVVSLLVVGIVNQPLAGQGFGGAASLGMYRSLSPAGWDQSPGIGAELMGRWAFRSGLVLGLGARYLKFPQPADDRVTVFLDGRYAPAPSLTRRVQPIFGLRAGPYMGGGIGDGDGSPLFGLEAAPVLGLSLRAGAGMSLTVTGDLGLVLSSNDSHPGGPRRFFPGLQVGVTLH